MQLTLTLLLAAGCERSTLRHEDLPRFHFPDSLAATVVELQSTDLEHAPNWQVDADSPFVIDGGEAGDTLFGEIAFVARMPDGRIAAADRRGARVRIFDSAGELEDTWGRQGQGPGEFQSAVWVSSCGTRGLAVFDLMLAVVTRFDSVGNVMDGDRVRPRGSQPVSAPVCNRFGDMAIVAQREWPVPLIEGLFRPLVTVSVGRSEQALRDVVRIPGTDSHRSSRMTGPLGDFARRPQLAITDTSIHIATGDAFEIAEFAFDGRLLRLIRAKDVAPIRITSMDLERVRQEQLAASAPRFHEQLERSFAELEWPVFHPVLDGLLLDSAGCLWVHQTVADTSTLVWRVLASSGEPVGTVTLPGSFTLTAVGADELIGYSGSRVNGGRVAIYRYHRDPSSGC